MQWQKISNIPLPIDEVVMIYTKNGKDEVVLFAKRFMDLSGLDTVTFHCDFWFIDGDLDGDSNYCTYDGFRREFSNGYWCRFKRPCE